MLEQPPKLPAPQQVLLHESSASNPSPARRVWVFSLPSTNILPLPMFLSGCLWMQIQLFSCGANTTFLWVPRTVCNLSALGVFASWTIREQRRLPKMFMVFLGQDKSVRCCERGLSIPERLPASARQKRGMTCLQLAKKDILEPFLRLLQSCAGAEGSLQTPQQRKADAARCSAQPWGENLKSLKKTDFTENKKEKERKILGRKRQTGGFFPSPS